MDILSNITIPAGMELTGPSGNKFIFHQPVTLNVFHAAPDGITHEALISGTNITLTVQFSPEKTKE